MLIITQRFPIWSIILFFLHFASLNRVVDCLLLMVMTIIRKCLWSMKCYKSNFWLYVYITSTLKRLLLGKGLLGFWDLLFLFPGRIRESILWNVSWQRGYFVTTWTFARLTVISFLYFPVYHHIQNWPFCRLNLDVFSFLFANVTHKLLMGS